MQHTWSDNQSKLSCLMYEVTANSSQCKHTSKSSPYWYKLFEKMHLYTIQPPRPPSWYIRLSFQNTNLRCLTKTVTSYPFLSREKRKKGVLTFLVHHSWNEDIHLQDTDPLPNKPDKSINNQSYLGGMVKSVKTPVPETICSALLQAYTGYFFQPFGVPFNQDQHW